MKTKTQVSTVHCEQQHSHKAEGRAETVSILPNDSVDTEHFILVFNIMEGRSYTSSLEK